MGEVNVLAPNAQNIFQLKLICYMSNRECLALNVLALIKNNKFNYLLFVNYFLLYSTHIHNALHGASAHLPAELRAKVRRLAVASLSTPGPQISR